MSRTVSAREPTFLIEIDFVHSADNTKLQRRNLHDYIESQRSVGAGNAGSYVEGYVVAHLPAPPRGAHQFLLCVRGRDSGRLGLGGTLLRFDDAGSRGTGSFRSRNHHGADRERE